jgi:hypothetical protein
VGKYQRLLVGALAVLALITLSCGEPLGPQTPAWVEVARLPDYYQTTALAAGSGDVVYVAVDPNTNLPAKILRGAGGGLEEIYTAPYEGGFSSITVAGPNIWAAGYKHVAGAYSPYLVHYDGSAWREVDVPADFPSSAFEYSFAAPGGVVWFGGGDAVYTYRNGVWGRVFYIGAPDFDRRLYLAVTPGGRAFVASVKDKLPTVSVSDDGGASWTDERLASRYGNFELVFTQDDLLITAAAEGLVVRATFHEPTTGTDCEGLLIRDDGPPGEGLYTLAFFAPQGPYFYSIDALAFADADNGYALGSLTSVAVRGGDWAMDNVPEWWSPNFKEAAAGPNAYWAVAETYLSQNEILYRAPR